MSQHSSKFSILHFRTKLALIGVFLFAIGSVFTAGGAWAANPSANLDQCANGSLASPNVPACNPNEWVNGNLGASKAHYQEGESIPYRMRFDNLSLASHTVVIEWDTTKSSKHAIDYLGSVKGVAPPTGTGIAHYTFSVNGAGSQGLDLKPKQ